MGNPGFIPSDGRMSHLPAPHRRRATAPARWVSRPRLNKMTDRRWKYRKIIYKNRKIIYKNRKIIYKNRKIIYKNRKIIYKNRTIIYKNRTIIYKNRKIIYKNRKIIYKNRKIIYKNRKIIYKNRKIIYKNRKIIYKNRKIIYKNRTIIYKNRKIAENTGENIGTNRKIPALNGNLWRKFMELNGGCFLWLKRKWIWNDDNVNDLNIGGLLKSWI